MEKVKIKGVLNEYTLTGRKFVCESLEENVNCMWNSNFEIGQVYPEVEWTHPAPLEHHTLYLFDEEEKFAWCVDSENFELE